VKIEENISLASCTTFRVGGPARFFVHAETEDDVRDAIRFATKQNLPFLILGGGSNILADDAGCSGVVIRIGLRGLSREGEDLLSEAGESWDGVVARAVSEGLWGIENLSSIPGTVGGAPVQNIGAYGVSLSETLRSLEALDLTTLDIKTFSKEECQFGYRDSLFKRKGGFVILRVRLGLSLQPRPRLSYRDVAERFEGIETPPLQAIRDAICSIRSAKFPDLSREGTAGSFFMNPIVSPEVAAALAARYPELPQFSESGGVKIPLAFILDKILGFRGKSLEGVRAFERQPLVLVNDGSASARGVRAFARSIQERVKQETGIDIVPEVRVMKDCSITRSLA